MGEIERVQRITAPIPVNPGRLHKTDEAQDQRRHHKAHDEDVIELHVEEVDETVVPPSVPGGEEPTHLDIAV